MYNRCTHRPVNMIVVKQTPIDVSVSCSSWHVVCCYWHAVDVTLPAKQCAL